MFNKTPPKGMRDFLPEELRFRNETLAKIKNTYAQYGFNEIETPCVDDINLLLSKQGGDNEKLIYKILKRGEKLENASTDQLCDLGLRFDLTVPLARYCANNAGVLPSVFKSMQIGNVFRAERPQKGRFRQFIQCDIDIIGEESIFAEIDLICATIDALKSVGLHGFTVEINDRRILKNFASVCGFDENAYEKAFIALDKLDKIGIDGVVNELKSFASDEIVDKFVALINSISGTNALSQCKKAINNAEIDDITSQLDKIINTTKTLTNENVEFNISLVRGMNYYTGTIFEVKVDGVNYSVAGGGRYDQLLGKITGNNVPACGFSIGFERIIGLLTENGQKATNTNSIAIVVPKEELDNVMEVYNLAKDFRANSNNCSVFKKMKNFAYQLKNLTDLGYGEIYEFNNGKLIKKN